MSRQFEGEQDPPQIKKVDREYLVPPEKRRGLAQDKPTFRMSLPRIRFGRRYVRLTSFIVPAIIAVVVLILGMRALTTSQGFAQFATDNPCFLLGGDSFSFPLWLRTLHWFNVLIMFMMIRSGLQILADHPRLYTSIHSTPGTEVIRFRGPVPEGRLWTALDDSAHLHPAIGLPGGRHMSGMARHWHFLDAPAWVLIGTGYVLLLFITDQWRQIVPTTLEAVPSALTCAATYSSLTLPTEALAPVGSFNSLQMIAYSVVVFILAPLSILTGLAMSPTITHRFAWYPRIFGNRQIARTIHFILLSSFLLFIVVHVGLVIWTGLAQNMNHMVLGTEGSSWLGTILGLIILAVIVLLLWLANKTSWTHPRKVQHTFQRLAGWLSPRVYLKMPPRAQWPESAISPFHWYNGTAPDSQEYQSAVADGFADWRLVVDGEVRNPQSFSMDELTLLPKHSQISETDCVQGWSGIAKWGGVPVREVLKVVEPLPSAKYIVFYAYPQPGMSYEFYDVHDLGQMDSPTALLAYEMNDETLPVLHGAPLRLRNGQQLGFKQVKWLTRISLVKDYRDIHQGEGGFREDNEYQARSSEI